MWQVDWSLPSFSSILGFDRLDFSGKKYGRVSFGGFEPRKGQHIYFQFFFFLFSPFAGRGRALFL